MTSEPPHVRRPRRLWIGLSAAVVLVGLLAAAAVALVRGDPPEFQPNRACCTPANEESPFIGGPLWNEGRFTVRITAVEGPPGTEALVVPVDATSAIDTAEPFAPFDLEPGTYREVFVRAEAAGCSREAVAAGGPARSSTSVRIEFTRFGLDQSTVGDTAAMGSLVFLESADGPCAYLDEEPED